MESEWEKEKKTDGKKLLENGKVWREHWESEKWVLEGEGAGGDGEGEAEVEKKTETNIRCVLMYIKSSNHRCWHMSLQLYYFLQKPFSKNVFLHEEILKLFHGITAVTVFKVTHRS